MDADELREILNRNLDFIKQADAKAGLLFSIQLVVMGFLIQKAYLFVDKLWSTLLLVGLTLLSGLALLFLAKTVYPKVSDTSTRHSLLYFGSIKTFTLGQFKKKIEKVRKQELRDDLICQVHTTSIIVSRKMNNLKIALWLFILFTGLSGVLTVIVKYC